MGATVSACATPAGRLADRVDNRPMYGQPTFERPAFARSADDAFVAAAMSGFASRRAASDAWWRTGEDFLARRDLDFAMRRYNEAWLLDSDSFRPYWGFARVLTETPNAIQAEAFFEQAIRRVDVPFERPALPTDAGSLQARLATSASDEGERKARREKAGAFFVAAMAADPTFGNAYKRHAMLLYDEGRYADAWSQVRLARARPPTVMPPDFVARLRKAMPEPE